MRGTTATAIFHEACGNNGHAVTGQCDSGDGTRRRQLVGFYAASCVPGEHARAINSSTSNSDRVEICRRANTRVVLYFAHCYATRGIKPAPAALGKPATPLAATAISSYLKALKQGGAAASAPDAEGAREWLNSADGASAAAAAAAGAASAAAGGGRGAGAGQSAGG
jgi:hypothetical protein